MAKPPSKRSRPGGLGRGLSALIGEPPAREARGDARSSSAPSPTDTRSVPIDRVRTSPWQPRHTFRPEAIRELAESIRERGILQPLWVRVADDGAWELIAGERRLRAARTLGLAEVPVRVLEADDREALELALIENLQREDLDPIEEAEGYRALAERFDLTQEKIAERVGRARASVANALRLLDLPEPIRTWISEGRLSVGHAKVLLGLPAEEARARLARALVKEGWSVRQTERAVARENRPTRPPRPACHEVPDSHVNYLADRLREKLGTGVSIHSPRTLAHGKKSPGSIRIDFYSSDDLDRLLEILGIADTL